MVSLRTRVGLVFGGVVVLAAAAAVAVYGGAPGWAAGLLGVQIVFAGGGLYLMCGSMHRRLEALRKQVESGGAVQGQGECAPLGRSISGLVESHRKATAASQEHLNVALDAEAHSRRAAQALIDGLDHGVALLTPKGRVELVNARGACFGLEKDKSADETPHAWLRALVARALETKQRTGLADCHGEKDAPTAGPGKCREGLVQIFEEGREMLFRPQARPLMNAQGELTGVALSFVDVTAAREADEARANLLAAFAHEIRTPMTSLQMSIYLLLDDAASRLTPRQLELLQAAREDADRLHRIMEDTLAPPKT